MYMSSFSLRAVGNLASNPELGSKGELTYARFRLIGNDYAGKDEEGAAREITTGVSFVAFGPLAETLARTCRLGDQLIVEAHIRADNWTDGNGERKYDYSFVVEGFRFGAPGRTRREELEAAGVGRAREAEPVAAEA